MVFSFERHSHKLQSIYIPTYYILSEFIENSNLESKIILMWNKKLFKYGIK